MRSLIEIINTNTAWLYFKLYECSYLFIDFWTIIHFFSGITILLCIELFQVRKKWVVLFASLFCYEVVEISILYVTLNIFKPETIKDQFTDVFVGMLGGLVASFLIKTILQTKAIESREQIVKNIVIIVVSFLISFLWVGFYGYRYSHEFFNSNGVNYTAFLLWWGGIIILGKIYYGLKSKLNSFSKTLLFSWGIYFLGLCLLEYLFYHVLGVREIGTSERKAMLFDIIHGTKKLYIFYLSVPIISITFFESLHKLTHKVLAAMQNPIAGKTLFDETFMTVFRYKG